MGTVEEIKADIAAGSVALTAMANAQANVVKIAKRIRTAVLNLEFPGGGGGGGEPPEMASTITRYGIKWDFDKEYPVGTYANGDPWVVGPVTIIRITPESAELVRTVNGSMINPSPTNGSNQGFDSHMKNASYSASKNVALNVSPNNSLVVPVNSSLVSTKSESNIHTPIVQEAEILTVVAEAPDAGDFRPPYCGTDKSSQFNVSELNYNVLGTLTATPNTPSISQVADYFKRPWIDFAPGWNGTEFHPVYNMPDYGRDMSDRIGQAALMLNVNFTNEEKRDLLIRFVQLGIDLQGVVDDGGHRNWMNNGGHASARKWPILFAGIVLNDDNLKSISTKDVWFGEDMQTWIVTESDVGRPLNPDPRAPKQLYVEADVGKAEWGIRHATSPISDNAHWAATYRTCCTANVWYGFLLAAMVMDARTLWDHEPLFLYQDRYLSRSRELQIPDWQISQNDWVLEMWDAYRSNYS